MEKEEKYHYSFISIIITGFLINMQVQGQYPQQWGPFQVAGLLHADLTPDLQVCLSWGSIAESFHSLWSLSVTASMSSWASYDHTFYKTVCHRLSWLLCWSVPLVHTSGAFSLTFFVENKIWSSNIWKICRFWSSCTCAISSCLCPLLIQSTISLYSLGRQ